jgi:mRNA interferase RelE/StbE
LRITSRTRPMSDYSLFLLPRVQKDMDRFGQKVLRQLLERVKSLAHNPRPLGSLKLTADEGYHLRSGDYRILYRIDEEKKAVYIYRIKDRKDA